MKSMKKPRCRAFLRPAALLAAFTTAASAQTSDIEQLKSAVQQMQRTIDELNAKIAGLEKTSKNTARKPNARCRKRGDEVAFSH